MSRLSRSTNAVLIVQPHLASICSMASRVPNTTRCVTPTMRRRRYDLTTWLPLRIREILYGSVLGKRDARTVLSSTYPHNELMRLCLLRWQSERRSAVFRPRWRVGITFSFNPRFLIVRTSDYQQRKYSLA